MTRKLIGYLQIKPVPGVEFPIFRETMEGTEVLWEAAPEVIGRAIADIISKYLNTGQWGKHLRAVLIQVQKPIVVEYVHVRRISQEGGNGSDP